MRKELSRLKKFIKSMKAIKSKEKLLFQLLEKDNLVKEHKRQKNYSINFALVETQLNLKAIVLSVLKS